MEQKYKVMLGIPSHDRRIDIDTAWATHCTGLTLGEDLGVSLKVRSLLALNFNELMCESLNNKEYTHFCLLHSDIAPTEKDWLLQMLNIMRRDKLDVLSVVSPIKDNQGRVSCALADEHELTTLTMDNLKDLPPTFGREDCQKKFGRKNLMFNTGLLLIKLSAINPEECCFKMVDGVVKQGVRFEVRNLPEDWYFSTQCMKNAVKYACTTEIKITHTGQQLWSNQP